MKKLSNRIQKQSVWTAHLKCIQVRLYVFQYVGSMGNRECKINVYLPSINWIWHVYCAMHFTCTKYRDFKSITLVLALLTSEVFSPPLFVQLSVGPVAAGWLLGAVWCSTVLATRQAKLRLCSLTYAVFLYINHCQWIYAVTHLCLQLPWLQRLKESAEPQIEAL